MTRYKSFLALAMAVCLILCSLEPVCGLSADELFNSTRSSAEQMVLLAPEPSLGGIGGDWVVLGLARSESSVPTGYFESYYERVEAAVASAKGVLSTRKYTEYSRAILALTAIGKDPADVAGYDLLLPLGDFEKTRYQGLNGSIWALLALDCGNYEIPENKSAKVQATRELYVKELLDHQLEDGGWNFSGKGASDADMTAMTIQALANYRADAAVGAAIEKGLKWLSENQNENGGYSSWGTENSESLDQVIVALCQLGIDLEDPAFVKNGNTLLDALMDYRLADGSFAHVKGNGYNQMATEQGFYAMAAAKRAAEGKTRLYDMSDVKRAASAEAGKGLPGKNEAVSSRPVLRPGVSFSDISGASCQRAVEELAARNIIDGMGDGSYKPGRSMTRAQFCTIVVKALGLAPAETSAFKDVAPGLWYSGYIGTANTYGIVEGVAPGLFNPGGIITRQEAAVMTARAARLCGLDTAMDQQTQQKVLSAFSDSEKTAAWARSELAFCLENSIFSCSAEMLEPKKPILRGEIAEMLYSLLGEAELL